MPNQNFNQFIQNNNQNTHSDSGGQGSQPPHTQYGNFTPIADTSAFYGYASPYMNSVQDEFAPRGDDNQAPAHSPVVVDPTPELQQPIESKIQNITENSQPPATGDSNTSGIQSYIANPDPNSSVYTGQNTIPSGNDISAYTSSSHTDHEDIASNDKPQTNSAVQEFKNVTFASDSAQGEMTPVVDKFDQEKLPNEDQNLVDDAGEDLKKLGEDELVINTSQSQKFSEISQLLDIVIERGASDLHITAEYPPFIRIDDKLTPIGDVLSVDEARILIMQSLSQQHRELLEVNREVDLSYQHENKGRFRINAYFERGKLAAAYRLIPQKIRSVTELGLPSVLIDITRLSQGLFLVTGPTGSGKSTTLAAMIQHINETAPKHIITIEDPIEYVYPKGMALVDQRELGSDTHDWNIAMKSALRQDPDVILIGELRDFETIQLALTLAETGHLVFGTLHTNSAAQSIDRIVGVFPPHQQQQIRVQLAGSLKGILSQRLVPLINKGRIAAIELLLVNPAVQNLIREGKSYQIDNIISTSSDAGMISLEKSLVTLVRTGRISTTTAQEYASRPDEILKLLKNQQM